MKYLLVHLTIIIHYNRLIQFCNKNANNTLQTCASHEVVTNVFINQATKCTIHRDEMLIYQKPNDESATPSDLGLGICLMCFLSAPSNIILNWGNSQLDC